MENEMIMTEIEESNIVADEMYCDDVREATAGEKAIVLAVLGLTVTGAVSVGKRVWNGVKSLKERRKAKKILKKAEFVDLGEERIDSEEESD